MTPIDEEFATRDLALAEDQMRRSYYRGQRLSLAGSADDFVFEHRRLGATGSRPFAINRLSSTATMRVDAEPTDDVLVTVAPRRGVISFDGAAEFDSAAAGPGDVLLGPPRGDFTSWVDRADLDVTTMSRAPVVDLVAARYGLVPAAVRFTDLAPVSAWARALWTSTIAHVRDDLLADAELAASPIVLDGAFDLLASTMLTTFPNTALDALSGTTPGHVGDHTVRIVIDHLHAHADRPVAPAEVAEVAGAPACDVDDALRRRHASSAALQLWHARIRGSYRTLSDADPDAGDTVEATAVRWGFTHVATFAVAYTLAAGESPTTTLHRR